MLAIDPQFKTERENYKLLTGSIIPRPIAFVLTKGTTGVINGAPFSYFNIVAADPPLLSLSIQRKEGNTKDTVKNIIETKAFVIHMVDEQNVQEVNKAAANLAYTESELDSMNVTLINSNKINVPAMKEAKARYECVLEKHLPIQSDTGRITTDLIIGRIVQYHFSENIYMAEDKINHENTQAVSRLAGNQYAIIGSTFEIERPK